MSQSKPRSRGKGKVPTQAKLKEAEKALQAQAMMVLRVSESMTHQQIASMFAVSPQLVAQRLASARAAQFAQLAQEIISERMLPKALTVLEQQLEAGNYEAARDLLNGMQVFQKGGKAVIEHVTSNSPTLESIRRERAKAVDGEVVKVEDDPGPDASN